MVSPDMPTKDVNKLLIEAWQLGVKDIILPTLNEFGSGFRKKEVKSE